MKHYFICFSKDILSMVLLVMLSFGFCVDTSIVQGTNYYVDAINGNDSWSGQLSAPNGSQTDGPWKTATKVKSFNFQASDKIYFHAGAVFNNYGPWVITIGGTANDYFTIGAYYNIGGNPAYDLPGILANGGRPIFDGGWGATSLDSCICSICYESAFEFKGDYSRIENIAIRYFKGRAITFNGALYCIASHCSVNHVLRNGVLAVSGADYATIEYNTINDAGKIGRKNLGASLGCNWPAIISVTRAKYAHVHHNTITDSFGEGIGIYTNTGNPSGLAGYSTVEYNSVSGLFAAGIYTSNAPYNVVRFNKVVGTTNTSYARYDGKYVGHAYLDANESLGGGVNTSHHNEFYGNMAAFTAGCFCVGGNDTNGNVHDDKFWNNTCISNEYQLTSWSNGPTQNHYNIDVRNNIFFCASADDCTPTYLLKPSYFSSIDYNYWSSDPASGYRGTHSFYTGTTIPTIKTNGWQSFDSSTAPDFSDFQQSADAGTKNIGVDLGGAPHNVDYWGTNRDANTPWDIGAHEKDLNSGFWLLPAQQEGLNMSIYPNPSAPGSITVAYELQEAVSDVSIYILNEMGTVRKFLEYKKQDKGAHQLQINTIDYAQGIYCCKLVTGGGLIVRKFIVA